MSNVLERFVSRFDFQIPADYASMLDTGLFDSEGPRNLQLTDFHWLTPDEMLNNGSTPVAGGQLVPFAESGTGDRWCWNTAWTGPKGVPVAFAARGQRSAEGYAENFSATVYRRLLEEYSASWLLGTFVQSTQELEERFRRYAKDVSPYLPPKWAATLAELSARPVLELQEGVYGTLQPEEAKSIVQRDLAFAQLGRTIKLRS